MTLRWGSPCSARGADAVSKLWRGRDVMSALMVVGAGFDPRAAVAYECISAAAPVPVDVMRCQLPMPTLSNTKILAHANRARIDLAAAACKATIHDHDPGEADTGMSIARSIFAVDLFQTYAEIIVDVSALPRGVYFPLIRGLLDLFKSGQWSGQLHVVACDNPAVDDLVTGEGVETPRALPGFTDLDADEAVTTIWVPVLGEGEAARLDVLNEDIRAGEICPVLPFPAANPRRADNLIVEYRELLLDSDRVELRNFIYAHESNPFDLYRTLSELNADYAQALLPLGKTRMVLSAHSSKLLSVGVLLTAFEHGLEVRHASPSVYGVRDLAALAGLEQHDLVVDLWLTGQPYE
jgi:hypothetical protein